MNWIKKNRRRFREVIKRSNLPTSEDYLKRIRQWNTAESSKDKLRSREYLPTYVYAWLTICCSFLDNSKSSSAEQIELSNKSSRSRVLRCARENRKVLWFKYFRAPYFTRSLNALGFQRGFNQRLNCLPR